MSESDSFRFLGMTKLQFLGFGIALVSVLFLCSTIMLALSVRQNSHKADELIERDRQVTLLVEETHRTFCAVKADAQAQVQATADLLAEHPGEVIFGIPRELIQRGLEADRAYRDSLVALDCDETPPKP